MAHRGLLAVTAALALALAACSSSTHHSSVAAGPGAQSPLPVATGAYPMFGHAPDFSWVAGRVESSLSCTYVAFGSEHDIWGGRLPLNLSTSPFALAGGDTIVIRGMLDRLADGACGAPSYLVHSIEEH